MTQRAATQGKDSEIAGFSGDVPLPLNLDLMFGKGFLWAEDVALTDWITLESLRMEIPDLSFPFDAGGGVERFRDTRCQVREIEISIDESGFASRLARATERLDEFYRPRVQFLDDAIHVTLQLRAFGEPIHLSFRAALLPPEPPRADELHLSLYDYRWFGPLPYPARLLAFEWLTGVLDTPHFSAPGRGRPFQVGVAGDIASFRPFKLLLAELFPVRGWKLPSLADVVLDDVRIRDGSLHVRATSRESRWGDADEPVHQLRDSHEGRRALAAYESKDLFARADEALFAGELDDAMRLLSGYRDQYGLHPQLAGRMLDCLLADPTAGHVAEATSICETLLEENPDDLRAHIARAVMAMIDKGRDAALEHLDTLSDLLRSRGDAPDWVLAELTAADLLEDVDPADAAERLDAALSAAPHDRAVLERLRELYQRLGETDRLEGVLERLTAVYDNRDKLRDTYVDLARHLMHREGELAEARQYLQKALDLRSDDLEALETLGESYELSDKPMRAVRALSSAARAAEDRRELTRARELQFRVARIWRDDLEEPEQALLTVRRALSTGEVAFDEVSSVRRPMAIEHARQLAFAAELCDDLDREDEAIGHWSEAVSLLERIVDAEDVPSPESSGLGSPSPDSPVGRLAVAHRGLARVYENRGRTSAAIRHWERHLELDPSYREAVERLADLYKRAGRADKLVALFERRLAVVGDSARSADLHRQLADIHDRLGREEEAERHRDRAEAIGLSGGLERSDDRATTTVGSLEEEEADQEAPTAPRSDSGPKVPPPESAESQSEEPAAEKETTLAGESVDPSASQIGNSGPAEPEMEAGFDATNREAIDAREHDAPSGDGGDDGSGSGSDDADGIDSEESSIPPVDVDGHDPWESGIGVGETALEADDASDGIETGDGPDRSDLEAAEGGGGEGDASPAEGFEAGDAIPTAETESGGGIDEAGQSEGMESGAFDPTEAVEDSDAAEAGDAESDDRSRTDSASVPPFGDDHDPWESGVGGAMSESSVAETDPNASSGGFDESDAWDIPLEEESSEIPGESTAEDEEESGRDSRETRLVDSLSEAEELPEDSHPEEVDREDSGLGELSEPRQNAQNWRDGEETEPSGELDISGVSESAGDDDVSSSEEPAQVDEPEGSTPALEPPSAPDAPREADEDHEPPTGSLPAPDAFQNVAESSETQGLEEAEEAGGDAEPEDDDLETFRREYENLVEHQVPGEVDADSAGTPSPTIEAGTAPTPAQRVERARQADDPSELVAVLEEIVETYNRAPDSIALDEEGYVDYRRELGELLYFDLGREQQAREHLEAVYEYGVEERDGVPDDGEVLRALDSIYESNGEVDERIEILEARVRSADNPELAAALRVLMARLHWEEHDDRQTAEQQLEAVLEESPDHAGALRLQAEMARREEDWQTAAETLETLLDVDDGGLDSNERRRELATIYIDELDDPDRAAELYEALLEDVPGDDRALEGLQDAHAKREDWASYLEALGHEIGLMTGRTEAIPPEELANLDAEDFDGASELVASETLAEAGSVADDHLGRDELAREIFGTATRVWSENVDALQRRIELDRRLGANWDLAADLVTYAESLLDPTERFSVLFEAARLWRGLGELHRARTAVEGALGAADEADANLDRLEDARELAENLRESED